MMRELWNYVISHLDEIADQTIEHLQLTIISMILATIIGVMLGILITKVTSISKPILGFTGIIQTIPSLALLGFLLPVFGIGKIPAVIALFLYALLPIVRNTFTGISEVDRVAKEAAVGMGMKPLQILRFVEIPLAFPVILAGIKTSTVINVGVATLCAFIGAGGLGEFIFRGISLNNSMMILAGAIPASILAVLLDFVLGVIQKNYKKKWASVLLPILLLTTPAAVTVTRIRSSDTHKLTAGFNSEFIEREDGFKGLDHLYDLPLNIREMEIGLMYKSLFNGDVEVIDGFSTDGRIRAYDLVLLKDNKNYFPPYHAAPIVNVVTLNRFPSLKGVFEGFSDLISGRDITDLNYQIDFKKRELSEVAYEFLKTKGITADKRAGNHHDPDVIIGSKAFTENYLLAYMFAQAIEGRTPLKTQLKLGFGGTKLVFDALRTGEIDLYPEYTGTGLLVILNTPPETRSTLKTSTQIYEYVDEEFQRRYGIDWMPWLGFNNTFALMMQRRIADSLKIESISALSLYLND